MGGEGNIGMSPLFDKLLPREAPELIYSAGIYFSIINYMNKYQTSNTEEHAATYVCLILIDKKYNFHEQS